MPPCVRPALPPPARQTLPPAQPPAQPPLAPALPITTLPSTTLPSTTPLPPALPPSAEGRAEGAKRVKAGVKAEPVMAFTAGAMPSQLEPVMAFTVPSGLPVASPASSLSTPLLPSTTLPSTALPSSVLSCASSWAAGGSTTLGFIAPGTAPVASAPNGKRKRVEAPPVEPSGAVAGVANGHAASEGAPSWAPISRVLGTASVGASHGAPSWASHGAPSWASQGATAPTSAPAPTAAAAAPLVPWYARPGMPTTAPVVLCHCGLPAQWQRSRWFCLREESAGGCTYEHLVPPVSLTPLCDCSQRARWEPVYERFVCGTGRPSRLGGCGATMRPEPEPQIAEIVGCRELELEIARTLATSLTAVAYEPSRCTLEALRLAYPVLGDD